MSSQPEDADATELIANALKFKIKIWDTAKLDSVLSRCLEEPSTIIPTQTSSAKQRNPHTLSKLLQSERLHGSSERDPTQKRHDFHYFGRGSHFVLIEDMYGELATIAAHEYPAPKKADDDKTPWPTLYCHPQARGPFVRFDEREKRRWERLQQAEKKEKEERRLRRETLLKKLPLDNEMHMRPLARKAGDLRRSVSLNNMANIDPFAYHDGDGDVIDSANASGYLASGLMGYTAASGNSVNITSTTGTTSTSNYASRALQIPCNLTSRMRMEVVMRKQPQEKLTQTNPMGPPADVPQRSMVLKKSKSTNTLKLPKREEGSKPGYCESCRQKFDDFKEVSFLLPDLYFFLKSSLSISAAVSTVNSRRMTAIFSRLTTLYIEFNGALSKKPRLCIRGAWIFAARYPTRILIPILTLYPSRISGVRLYAYIAFYLLAFMNPLYFQTRIVNYIQNDSPVGKQYVICNLDCLRSCHRHDRHNSIDGNSMVDTERRLDMS